MARRIISLRLTVAIAVLAVLPLLGGWWTWQRSGPLQQPATVLVRKGTSIRQVSEQLERDGVIRSASLFRLWARARKLQLIRGEYSFESGASLADVAGRLRRAEIRFTQVNIPEGAHAWSVQKRLKDFVPEEVFWTLWRSPRLARTAGFEGAPNLEGLVAPATYRLHHAMEPEEVMLMLVEAFRDQIRPRLEGGPLPPYETLILASLVEKETRVAEEQPRVAGVYKKRLELGMRLQCDPTSLYARWLSGDLRFTAPLMADIRRAHPFNTYSVGGLPPTPIGIPGSTALAAAMAPLKAKDLYFVATGTGGHRFAGSLGEHNRNVGIYRQEIARQKRAARG